MEAEGREWLLGVSLGEEMRAAVCLVDLSKHTFYLAEFAEGRFLANLETLLEGALPENKSKIDAVVFFPRSQEKQKKLESLLAILEIPHRTGNWSELHTVERDHIKAVLKKNLAHYMGKRIDCERALDIALAMAIRYKLVEDQTNHNVFEISILDLEHTLSLDSRALSALHIISKTPIITQADKERDLSLFTLVDSCKTKMGPRILRRWMLQPLVSKSRIEDRLDMVEYLVLNEPVWSFFTMNYLSAVSDLDAIGTRLFKVHQSKPAEKSLMDICKVYQAVRLSNSAYQFVRQQIDFDLGRKVGISKEFEANEELEESVRHCPSSDQSPFGHRLDKIAHGFGKALELFNKYIELVEKYIDVGRLEQGEVVVKHSASPEISAAEDKVISARKRVEAAIKSAEREIGIEIPVERDGAGIYLLRVPKKSERAIASKGSSSSGGYKIVSARANHIMVTNYELKQVSLDLIEAEEQHKEAQRGAASKIVEILSAYYPAIEELAEFLGELDSLCALATFSRPSMGRKMVRPIFNEGNRLVLRQSRHPLLDRTVLGGPIPNDCEMLQKISSFHLITGPNMGGKSTYIRQVALNVVLAQMGCYCCAEFAELPVFERLITRVGAGDVQAKGLSTWMSELLEVSCMLESGRGRALLIVDELGRGTSTSEGIGMTQSIAEHLLVLPDIFCLFATHFFELTKLEQEWPSVKNFHAEADISGRDIQMTYLIKPGHTDKSYGVHILSLLGFPKSIVEFSKEQAKMLAKNSANTEISPRKETNKLDMDGQVQIIKAFKQAKRAGLRQNMLAELKERYLSLQAEYTNLKIDSTRNSSK